MEKVSLQARRRFLFSDLFVSVPKPRIEEIEAHKDSLADEIRIMADDAMCQPEAIETERSLIKSILRDDKQQLLTEANRLLQTMYGNSTKEEEDEADEDRVEYRGIVSRLLRSCCLFDSVNCATALLDGEVLGTAPLVNEMDESGYSPLHTAASVHAIRCVELLLRRKARTDFKTKDERQQVPLELSLSSRRMDVVWKVDDPIEDLLVCLNQKNLTAVRLIAEKTKELAEVAYSIAINGQAVGLAALLMVASDKVLEPGVEVGLKAASGTKEKMSIYDCIMREALALGREEDAPLLTSCARRRRLILCAMELCQLFGAFPGKSWAEKKAASPLIVAVQAGDLEVVKLLLETKVDINQTDAEGNSALHWSLKMNSALAFKQIKIMWLLLKHSARVTQKNKLGMTALHLAASCGNYQAVQIIISEEPSSVHTVTEMKETPLFFAVRNNHKECVELLLHSGANSEVLNIRKQRPIDFANSQDMRFMLSPANFRLSNRSIQSKQKLFKDDQGISGFTETQLVVGNDTTTKESSAFREPCKYFNSLHGCVRGATCFYMHDEEHGPVKKGRHASCFQGSELRRKIFAGGLPPTIQSDSLGKYFEHFGNVEDAIVVRTQNCEQTHSRGFGFVTFKSEKSVIVAVQAHYISIMGKDVEIKSCVPRSQLFSEPGKAVPQDEIRQDHTDLDLLKPGIEVKMTDEDHSQKRSWADKLLQSPQETRPPNPPAQAFRSSTKVKEPKWLSRFRKWFPRHMSKTFKSLGEGKYYALSSLKADFRTTFGLELDHSSIGISKLSVFLASFSDTCQVKYITEKGTGSPTHMILLPNLSSPSKQPATQMMSLAGHTCSQPEGPSTGGQPDGSKLLTEVSSIPIDGSDGCGSFHNVSAESGSPSPDHCSYTASDDFMLLDVVTPPCAQAQSYTQKGANDLNDFRLIQDVFAKSGALSAEFKVCDLATNFKLLGDATWATPFEDNSFLNKRFPQFLSLDPIFHARPWLNNETGCGSKSSEADRHLVLEALARRNNTSKLFLREFDFPEKYSEYLAQEKCFACRKRSMSWANHPCRHLLWCDDCRNLAVRAAGRSEHKCVICDSTVESMVHNLTMASWTKVIQPPCLKIMDYEEFPPIGY